jgi:hypothetical protein
MDAFDLMSDYEDDQVTIKQDIQTVEITKSTGNTSLEKMNKEDQTDLTKSGPILPLKRNFSSMTGDADSKDNSSRKRLLRLYSDDPDSLSEHSD